MNRDELLAQLRAQISELETVSPAAAPWDGMGGLPKLDVNREHSANASRVMADARTSVKRASASGKRSIGDEEAIGDEATAALGKVVMLVNASDKSEKAVRERLSRDGFSEEAIDEAVHRAKGYGFIDDDRFAEILIRSRVSQGKGSIGIERELRENGIDADSLEGWPYEYAMSFDEEVSRALDVLERKPPRSKNIRDGAYRKLAQRGFPSSVASTAARTWAETVER